MGTTALAQARTTASSCICNGREAFGCNGYASINQVGPSVYDLDGIPAVSARSGATTALSPTQPPNLNLGATPLITGPKLPVAPGDVASNVAGNLPGVSDVVSDLKAAADQAGGNVASALFSAAPVLNSEAALRCSSQISTHAVLLLIVTARCLFD